MTLNPKYLKHVKKYSFKHGDVIFVKVDPKKTWKAHFDSDFIGTVVTLNPDRDCYGIFSELQNTTIGWYDSEDLTLLKTGAI